MIIAIFLIFYGCVRKRAENTKIIFETLKTGGGERSDSEPDTLMELVDVAAPNADIQLDCRWDSTAVFIGRYTWCYFYLFKSKSIIPQIKVLQKQTV
jgi:hypothetical protein